MGTWILCLPLALNACSACGPRGPGRARPNLLLLTVDSLRADHVGFGGFPSFVGAQTPNMDDLARRGVVFSTALTPSPEALPALVSLHTGMYRRTAGETGGEAEPLPREATTLAEILKPLGYRTAAFAATLELHPKYGLDQGFDVYSLAYAEAPRPSQSPERGILAEKVADQALEFLEAARKEPFFLWVNFYDPHYFYSPPEPFAAKFADRPYDGEVAYVDREIGRILATLRDYELEAGTIVVLAGSNGEGLGDHGEEYHGVTLQAATTRVPLVIAAGRSAGAALSPGRRLQTASSLVDVAPTVLDLMGLPKLEGADGVSLAGPVEADRPLFLETSLPQRLFGWKPLAGVVSGRWKYVAGSREELFDLSVDTRESNDCSASHPDELKRLKALVAGHAGLAGPPRAMDDQVKKEILGLGYAPVAASRAVPDPRDMTGVANQALKAERSRRRGQVEAAALLFGEVLKQEPDNLLGLLGMSQILAARRDPAAALRLLERARDLQPEAGETYHQIGHLVPLLGSANDTSSADRANRLFWVATRLDPANEEALYDLACGLALRGERDAALDALEQAVRMGFRDFGWMSRDTDLNSIRSYPRFESITGIRTKRPSPPAEAVVPPAPQAPRPQ